MRVHAKNISRTAPVHAKRCRHTFHTLIHQKYLKAEFVEEEVDEVLDAGQDALIQVLPRDALEDDAEERRLQVVVETEVELVPMDRCLEH